MTLEANNREMIYGILFDLQVSISGAIHHCSFCFTGNRIIQLVVVHCMIELIDLIKYQTVFELDESSYHFLIPFELMSISLRCWIVCL